MCTFLRSLEVPCKVHSELTGSSMMVFQAQLSDVHAWKIGTV